MKILLVSTGTAGDILPFVAIGAALAQRGHTVHVLTPERYAGAAAQSRLEHHPLPPATDLTDEPDLYDPVGSMKVLARPLLAAVRPVFEFISALERDEWTIVAPPQVYGARIAQEIHGYGLVTCTVGPGILRSVHRMPITPGIRVPQWAPLPLRRMFFAIVAGLWDRALAPSLNDFRQELQLRPVDDIFFGWSLSPERVIGLFPEWFAPRAEDWPAQFIHGGFVIPQAGADPGLPPPLQSPGDPIVTFCAGSAGRAAQKFFDAAIDASDGRPWRALLLAPGYQPGRGSLPSNVVCSGFLPLGYVLPASGAVVHHGGMGTLSCALAHGVPQVVVPFGHDQFDNADRIVRLGVGLRILSDSRLARSMGRAVEQALNDQILKFRAAQTAKRFDPKRGLSSICSVIEETWIRSSARRVFSPNGATVRSASGII